MKKTIHGFVVFLFLTLKASACGLVYAGDASARLVTEKTLIVWNEKEKTEDFIRTPQIETTKDNVGFIVPVPNIPEVTEVDDNIFSELDTLIEERRPVEYKIFRKPFAGADGNLGSINKSFDGAGVPGSRGGVVVVREFKLSKYEVKVVRANDLEAFKKWLEENNYAFRPAFETWLKNYVNDRYYLTVFKFKKEQKSAGLKAQAVSIKFDADVPFYPYRDSSDTPSSTDRNLKLYFLSDKSYEPDFTGSLENKPTGFRGSPEFSAKVHVQPRHDKLHFGSQNWLTVWTDSTEQRPDLDITFKAASESFEEILPEARIVYLDEYFPLFIAAVLFIGILAAIFWIALKIFKKLSRN